MNPPTKLRSKFPATMRLRSRLSIARSEKGQSLVELALLTPLLLLLLIGIVEMGRYAYLSIVLGNAAETGALYGAQSLADAADASGIQAAEQNDYNDGHSLSGKTTVTFAPPTNTCGCDTSGAATFTKAKCSAAGAGTCATGHWVVNVQVTASGTFTSLFKYPGIPQSLTVVRTVTMRVKF